MPKPKLPPLPKNIPSDEKLVYFYEIIEECINSAVDYGAEMAWSNNDYDSPKVKLAAVHLERDSTKLYNLVNQLLGEQNGC